ncbi:MAG: universal stress protein [Bacteriovoracaceae bacterium]
MFYRPNILVATDLSETSDLALEAAGELCRRSSGNISVVHVSQIPEQWDWLSGEVDMTFYPDNYREQLLKAVRDRLEDQINRCLVNAEIEIAFGHPVKGILETADKRHADIIILGHRGKGTHFHLGDVAAKVVAASSRPVLVINREFSLDRVAGLIDPFLQEKRIFSVTAELAGVGASKQEYISLWPDVPVFVERDVFNSNIKVDRLTDERKKNIRTELEQRIRDNIDRSVSTTIRAEVSPEHKLRDGIVRVLEEDQVDVAVMSKHQKGKLEKILLGSSTRGVLDHWKGNLLVLPS